MKRLIVALALVASLGMAGHALAMDKKINIFNGAQYDIGAVLAKKKELG